MGTRRKLDIVVDAEYEGKREIQQAERDVKGLGAAASNSSFSMSGMASALAPVAVGLGAVAIAAKATWDTFKEGATLVSTESKFNALSDSIGASGLALDNLRKATKGMVSDSELMAGASELISYGIAKNESEMTAWSRVVGGLNLDMQVLGLTLANNSKARLDSLGLSLEDVNKRTREFVKAGKSADEAFDLAVLDALNARMDLLGDSMDGATKDAAILEASWKNLTDAAKKATANGLGPYVNSLSNAVTAQQEYNIALEKGIVTQDEINDLRNDGATPAAEAAFIKGRLDLYNEEVMVLEESADAYLAYQQAVYDSLNQVEDATMSGAAGFETYKNALIGADLQQEAFNESQEAGRQALLDAQESYTTITGFISGMGENATTATTSMKNFAAATMEQANAALVASGAMTPLEAAIANISAKEGLGLIPEGEADRLRDAAIEFENFNTIIQGNVQAFTDAGLSAEEQGQIIADKLDLISTTAISTEDQMRLMAIEGGDNLMSLGGNFDDLENSAYNADIQISKLKDLIIDGLPNEKIITIKIKTEGSIPSALSGGGGSTHATTTAVSGDIAR